MFRRNESEENFFDLNKSDLFGGSVGGGGGGGGVISSSSSSSKAVLSALRALQDKIRRLEKEKLEITEENIRLQSQLKSLEIENEHTRERENLHNQKRENEVRMAYEKLLKENNEIENHLNSLRKQFERVNEDLQRTIASNNELEGRERTAKDKLQQPLINLFIKKIFK